MTDLNDNWAVRVWIEQDLDTGAPLYEAELCDCGPGGDQTMLWRGRGPTGELALVNLAHVMATELEARAAFLPDRYRDVADRPDDYDIRCGNPTDDVAPNDEAHRRNRLARSLLESASHVCGNGKGHELVLEAIAALDGASIEQLAAARA